MLRIAICVRCKKEKKIDTNNHCKQCYKHYLRERSPKVKCACGCDEWIYSIGCHGCRVYYKRGHVNKGKSGMIYKIRKGQGYIDPHGYEYVYKPYHPYCNDWGHVRKHRLVKEIYLSILNNLPVYIHPNLIVHHINEVKNDNRPQNLQILTSKQHGEIHYCSDYAP